VRPSSLVGLTWVSKRQCAGIPGYRHAHHLNAANVGRNPAAYRLTLLGGKPRFVNILKQVADKSDWGTPAAAGRFCGVTLTKKLAKA
jgi:hypothetical protein